MILCVSCNSHSQPVKEGDLIFQFSKSQQSPYIAMATGSIYTHCGIIVFKDNNPYVLEASNVVKLTPLNEWINKGRWQHYKVIPFEYTEPIEYEHYLGKKYDSSFKLDNDIYYCSELIYDIYLKQFDIHIAIPKQVKEYNILGMKNLLEARGIDVNQKVVAPSDIVRGNNPALRDY